MMGIINRVGHRGGAAREKKKIWAYTLKEGVWSQMSEELTCPLASSPGESA